MGYKAIKEKYRIEHIVQISNNRICIGSPYINDIIAISMDGKIVKGSESDCRCNKDLSRYFKELKADEGEVLKDLIDEEDHFDSLLPVYTYENGRVIMKWCEKYGYPNVTSDGELMYENTFFKFRKRAVRECRRDAHYGVISYWRSLKEAFTESRRRMGRNIKWMVQAIWHYIVSRFQF